MKVSVDLDVCVGHGRCYDLAPAIFDEDEHGHCVLKLAEPPPDLEAAARHAADNCPEGAISIDGD